MCEGGRGWNGINGRCEREVGGKGGCHGAERDRGRGRERELVVRVVEVTELEESPPERI